MTRPVRIANCSGFYGDRRAAAREVVEGGPIDVLTGDWLAELTMLILAKARDRGRPGWAATFLAELEPVLGTIAARGIRVVANAGGLDPAGCAEAVRGLAERLGVAVAVAHVEGDDLLGHLDELRAAGWSAMNLDTGEPLPDDAVVRSANAYLGGWGITEALDAGAQVVVTGRVTDAAVVSGAASWWHGWGRGDLDRLAGAVVAGHVIECGPQATGGNFSFFQDVPGLERPGFPIAEVDTDGAAVITKHPGTGGAVTVETVTAQLLYEIAGPRYAGPDVVVDFGSVDLVADGPDRVRISGTTGEPPPPTLKVAVNLDGGFRNSVTFHVTGDDAEAKAWLAEDALWASLPGGAAAYDHVERVWWPSGRPDPASNLEALSSLRLTVRSHDERRAGRAFADAAVGLALSNYPGLFLGAPPGPAQEVGAYWPAAIDRASVGHVVVLPDGRRQVMADPPTAPLAVDADEPGGDGVDGRSGGDGAGERSGSATVRCPLGAVVGARSGDKGGNANLGVWARTPAGFEWLDRFLTTGRLRALLPDVCEGRQVRRYRFPNLAALNFVVIGLLGRGAAASDRPDPQAKGLGEYLRAKVVDVPAGLVST